MGGPPAARWHGGRVADCGAGSGTGASPVRGHRGGRLLVGVRGGAIWVVRLLPVAAVAALVTAGLGSVGRFAGWR